MLRKIINLLARGGEHEVAKVLFFAKVLEKHLPMKSATYFNLL